MKYILLCSILFLNSSILMGQKKSIKIETVLHDVGCKTDSIERFVKIRFLKENKYSDFSNFSYKGCVINKSIDFETGKYKILFSAQDYTTDSIEIFIDDSLKDIKIPIITLSSLELLDEVTVTGLKKSFIKIESDKTTISIEGNDILSKGSTYEAIGKLPGVIITPTGNIAQNGKISAIYIDGEASSISGEDLVNFLNSLPANTIEKIELISNPGAKYNANTSGGIINIITKSKNITGINGTLNISNTINGNNKNTSSLQLNGKQNAISWQFLGGYYYNEGDQELKIKSNYSLLNSTSIFYQNTKNEFLYRGFYTRIGLKYSFKDKSSINLNYNFWTNGHNPTTTINNFTENYTPIINTVSKAYPKTKNVNNELILKYKQNLDSLGRNFQLTLYGQIFQSDYLGKAEQYGTNELFSINQADKKIENYYLKNDWEIPIKKLNLNLYFGGKIGTFTVNKLGKYNLNNFDSSILNNLLYNIEIPFNYKENNIAFYSSFNKSFEKLEIGGGLRIEYFDIKSYTNSNVFTVNTNYTKLFPNINFLYKPNSNINFSLSYSKRINQPNYSDLDPNINNFNNSYLQNVGNPFLTPELVDNYQAKLTAFNYSYFSFGYSYEKSKNLSIIENDGTSINSIQYLKSFENVKTYSANLGIPIPFALFTKGIKFFKESNINPDKVSFLFANIGYNKTIFNNSEVLIPNIKPTWNFYAYSQFILPLDFKLNIYYSYMSKGTYNIYDIVKPIQSMEVSLSNKFFKKLLSITFSIQNALNNSGNNVLLYNQNITTDYNRIDERRLYKLSISYNFGKYKNLKKNDDIDINTETKSSETNNKIGKL